MEKGARDETQIGLQRWFGELTHKYLALVMEMEFEAVQDREEHSEKMKQMGIMIMVSNLKCNYSEFRYAFA